MQRVEEEFPFPPPLEGTLHFTMELNLTFCLYPPPLLNNDIVVKVRKIHVKDQKMFLPVNSNAFF